MNVGQENSAIMDHHYQHPPQQFPQYYQDPLGIVVYNDLPDGATCFNRTLATRDSSRSCPGPSTSSTTLKSSRTMQRINRPSSSIRSAAPQNLIYETVDKPAQYLGSFPVRAVDQSTRANLVRKQLSAMKDVPAKRPVLVNISLEGIKVCCPQGQSIYSSHSLRRISYATCDPTSNVLAFLAREAHAPLHLQHCHVFRTRSPSQAEDLNTQIGNAFKIAFANQVSNGQDDLEHHHQYHRSGMKYSRSADSLDLGIADLDPIYETPKPPPVSAKEDIFSIQVVPNDKPNKTCKSSKSYNALPMLNCLFNALNKQQEQEDTFDDFFTYNNNRRVLQDTLYAQRRQTMNKSKSAHLINSDYAEVADHAADQPSFNLTTLRTRRPGHWNVDAVRHHTLDSDLMVSPGCSRNGSSGFSSGEASTNSSATTPPPLITNHILESKSILEEPELQNAPWFQDAMPRELSLEVLKRDPPGSFIVRSATSKNGLALSVRVPQDFHPEGILNYLIIRAPKGFKIKGCQKQFATLNSLLIHHSVMPEMLPCPLLMNRFNNPIYRNTEEDSGSSQNGEDNEDNYLDPERDYELINNLRKFIMNEVDHEETVLEDAHYH